MQTAKKSSHLSRKICMKVFVCRIVLINLQRSLQVIIQKLFVR